MSCVKLYRNRCIGCAICSQLAPHIFVMDTNDGKALLVDDEIGDIQEALVFSEGLAELRRLANKCPVDAIKVNK